jgi:hypothetical protein
MLVVVCAAGIRKEQAGAGAGYCPRLLVADFVESELLLLYYGSQCGEYLTILG